MTLAVFLRGMNLGKRRLTNDELKAAFVATGFAQVSTFRASGNVILYDVTEADPTERIEAGLREQLGYDVPTIVRTPDALRSILAFDGLPGKGPDGGKLQVMLLRDRPSADARQAVLALAESTDDELAFTERELYWLPRRGISTSELELARVDALLGLTTTRTLGTIAGVLKKC